MSFGNVEVSMAELLCRIKAIDTKEESEALSDSDRNLRRELQEQYQCKAKEEEIKWRQRSRYLWLKEGDRNAKFFHNFASYRKRNNMISVLLDGDRRLESQNEICDHVLAFYKDLFTKEDCDCPSLDKLAFSMIDEAETDLIEKQFNEEEVKAAVFDLGGEKAPRPGVFPSAFFQIFWENIKEDVMNFMNEFHERGKLSKHIGASFITLMQRRQVQQTLETSNHLV